MNMLKPVKVGWKALETALNTIVDGVNSRGVTTGSGLSSEESANGVLIWLTKEGTADGSDTSSAGSSVTQPWLTTPDGQSAAWVQIQVLSGSNIETMWVWGSAPSNPVPCSSIAGP
jgi:hypothetical protein